MNYDKKLKISFVILAIIFFIIGLVMSEPNNTNVSQLSYVSIPIIFLVNLFTVFICVLIAPSGLSIIIIFKIIFTIGYTSNSIFLPIYIYLPISLIHGIFEIICLYISYKITISHWKNYFSDIDDKFNVFRGLLYKTFTKYLPVIVSLLIIGSVLEVLISNKLAIYFS